MSVKYRQAKDGDWIQPIRRGYKMACCDCGLVHVLNFRIRDGKIQFQPRRDHKETRKRRRETKGPTRLRRDGL